MISRLQIYSLIQYVIYFIPFVQVSEILQFDLTVFSLQNYNAKLSDFGLAKDGPTGDKSHVSTRVMGTYGYAAPEYLATGTNHKSFFFICSAFLADICQHRQQVSILHY